MFGKMVGSVMSAATAVVPSSLMKASNLTPKPLLFIGKLISSKEVSGQIKELKSDIEKSVENQKVGCLEQIKSLCQVKDKTTSALDVIKKLDSLSKVVRTQLRVYVYLSSIEWMAKMKRYQGLDIDDFPKRQENESDASFYQKVHTICQALFTKARTLPHNVSHSTFRVIIPASQETLNGSRLRAQREVENPSPPIVIASPQPTVVVSTPVAEQPHVEDKIIVFAPSPTRTPSPQITVVAKNDDSKSQPTASQVILDVVTPAAVAPAEEKTQPLLLPKVEDAKTSVIKNLPAYPGKNKSTAAIVFGFVAMMTGIVLCCTGVGAVIGAPIIATGSLAIFSGIMMRRRDNQRYAKKLREEFSAQGVPKLAKISDDQAEVLGTSNPMLLKFLQKNHQSVAVNEAGDIVLPKNDLQAAQYGMTKAGTFFKVQNNDARQTVSSTEVMPKLVI